MHKNDDPSLDPSSPFQTRILFDQAVARIMLAIGVKNDSELARALGITPQSVAPAMKKKKIPSTWIKKLSEKYNISSDWLLFGREPMHIGEQTTSQVGAALSLPLESCPRCVSLEDEIKLLREVKTAQDETIKAQAETIKMYKIALETAQRDVFKGDLDAASPIVPPCAQPAHIFNNNTK